MSHLELEIVSVCIGVKPDLLDLRDVLVFLLKLFLLGKLILVFAEIHDLADRRIRIGNDFNEIQGLHACPPDGLLCEQDTQLLPIGTDDPDLRGPDFCVDTRSLLFDRLDSYNVNDFVLMVSIIFFKKA